MQAFWVPRTWPAKATLILVYAAVGCSGSHSPGTWYYCVVDPPANTTLARYNGKIGLTAGGRSDWCAPLSNSQPINFVPPLPKDRCTTACTNKKFNQDCTNNNLTALVGYPGNLSYTIYQSDLNKGAVTCTSPGIITGMGMQFNPATNMTEMTYGCVFPTTLNMPLYCDASDPKAQSPDPVSPTPGYDNYIATMSAASAATVQSDEDASQNGVLVASSGTRAFSFNISGSELDITALTIPFDSFSYQDKSFTSGTAALVGGTRKAIQLPGNSNGYAIPPGQVTFSLTAVDQNVTPYTLSATNSTPLTIMLDTPGGPQISGTLNGKISGHPLHADLNASLFWVNRPPVAIAKVSNVTFNSSNWAGARDVHQLCRTPGGVKDMSWHGVPDAKVSVMFDASSSYDPDPGDSLRYAWNANSLGPNPIGSLTLRHGRYHAVLTVQDQYYVSTVANVDFTVRDLAMPKVEEQCGSSVYNPNAKLIMRISPGDPAPFRSVMSGPAVSNGKGIVLNEHTGDQIIQLAEGLGKGVGQRVFYTASHASLASRTALRNVRPDQRIPSEKPRE